MPRPRSWSCTRFLALLCVLGLTQLVAGTLPALLECPLGMKSHYRFHGPTSTEVPIGLLDDAPAAFSSDFTYRDNLGGDFGKGLALATHPDGGNSVISSGKGTFHLAPEATSSWAAARWALIGDWRGSEEPGSQQYDVFAFGWSPSFKLAYSSFSRNSDAGPQCWDTWYHELEQAGACRSQAAMSNLYEWGDDSSTSGDYHVVEFQFPEAKHEAGQQVEFSVGEYLLAADAQASLALVEILVCYDVKATSLTEWLDDLQRQLGSTGFTILSVSVICALAGVTAGVVYRSYRARAANEALARKIASVTQSEPETGKRPDATEPGDGYRSAGSSGRSAGQGKRSVDQPGRGVKRSVEQPARSGAGIDAQLALAAGAAGTYGSGGRSRRRKGSTSRSRKRSASRSAGSRSGGHRRSMSASGSAGSEARNESRRRKASHSGSARKRSSSAASGGHGRRRKHKDGGSGSRYASSTSKASSGSRDGASGGGNGAYTYGSIKKEAGSKGSKEKDSGSGSGGGGSHRKGSRDKDASPQRAARKASGGTSGTGEKAARPRTGLSAITLDAPGGGAPLGENIRAVMDRPFSTVYTTKEDALVALISLLARHDFALVGVLADFTPATETEALARSLIELYALRTMFQSRLLIWVVQRELNGVTDINEAFRGSSLTTRMLTAYVDVAGHDWLAGALMQSARAVLDEADVLEVDGSVSKADRAANAARVASHAKRVVSDVKAALASVPSALAELAHMLSDQVSTKHGAAAQMKVMTDLLFLRFLLPMWNSPHKHALASKAPSSSQRRNLLLISKVLQSASSLAAGGQLLVKEAYMDELTPAITELAPLLKNIVHGVARAPLRNGRRMSIRDSLGSMTPPDAKKCDVAVRHLFAVADESAGDMVGQLDYAGVETSGQQYMAELSVILDAVGAIPEKRKRMASVALERRSIVSFLPRP